MIMPKSVIGERIGFSRGLNKRFSSYRPLSSSTLRNNNGNMGETQKIFAKVWIRILTLSETLTFAHCTVGVILFKKSLNLRRFHCEDLLVNFSNTRKCFSFPK